MTEFLILRLQGPMQAWGTHTYEDYRPVERFPTRSGLVGLLGACLGLGRKDVQSREALSASFQMAVRVDQRETEPVMFTDFHTVLEARKTDGKPNKNPVVSHREYLCDAHFTVVLRVTPDSEFSLERLEQAVVSPCYTPVLGRRSCPLSLPLFDSRIQADDLLSALQKIAPGQGIVYSEEGDTGLPRMRVRDVPMPTEQRQFSTREVFVIQQKEEHVPEPMPF